MSTLETRIAEVVSEHIPNQSIGTSTGGAGGGSSFRTCACGHRATVEYAELAPDEHDTTPLLNRKLADHVTAALAPAIREREAEAWDACVYTADKQWNIGHTSAQLLRNTNPYRADKLATL